MDNLNSNYNFDDDELDFDEELEMPANSDGDIELDDGSDGEDIELEDDLNDSGLDLGSGGADEDSSDEEVVTGFGDDSSDDESSESDEFTPRNYSQADDGKYYTPDGREVGFDDEGTPYYVDMFDYSDESESGESEEESDEESEESDNEYEESEDGNESDEYNTSGIDIDAVDSELRGENTDTSFDESESMGIEEMSEEEEAELNGEGESSDDEEEIVNEANTISASHSNDFIDSDGNLSVMNSGTAEDTFEIKTLSYKDIAISKRIRSGKTVDDLVQSIKSTGLLRPIIVAPLKTSGTYVLIDGYRRILACAKAGLSEIPAVINNKIKTAEIPVVEAMYNHRKPYTMQDTVDYIEYLEKEKGITNPSLIEFLMELDSGDYNKLKDIITDNDEDIVGKLMLGQLTIAQAFKNLEKRRAKESREEKDLKKAAKVYEDTEESGANVIEETGETGDEECALTEEQIESLSIDPTQLDNGIDDKSLADAVEESENIAGYEPHKQKVGEREYIDPAIKKAVMARDNSTCQCCKKGGSQFVDILDYHHILPVFLGGADTPENGIMLCVACHRLVHLHSTGDLHIDPELLKEDFESTSEATKIMYENEQVFKDEQRRFKKILTLGDIIRKASAARGYNRERFKKEHPNTGIGRRKPGKNAEQEQT